MTDVVQKNNGTVAEIKMTEENIDQSPVVSKKHDCKSCCKDCCKGFSKCCYYTWCCICVICAEIDCDDCLDAFDDD